MPSQHLDRTVQSLCAPDRHGNREPDFMVEDIALYSSEHKTGRTCTLAAAVRSAHAQPSPLEGQSPPVRALRGIPPAGPTPPASVVLGVSSLLHRTIITGQYTSSLCCPRRAGRLVAAGLALLVRAASRNALTDRGLLVCICIRGVTLRG